jgi:hypothetical protein
MVGLEGDTRAKQAPTASSVGTATTSTVATALEVAGSSIRRLNRTKVLVQNDYGRAQRVGVSRREAPSSSDRSRCTGDLRVRSGSAGAKRLGRPDECRDPVERFVGDQVATAGRCVV